MPAFPSARPATRPPEECRACSPEFIQCCEDVGAEAVVSDPDSFGLMVQAQLAMIRDLLPAVLRLA
jgi:hypothetical protein